MMFKTQNLINDEKCDAEVRNLRWTDDAHCPD